MLFRKKKFLFSLVAFVILAVYQHFAGPYLSDYNKFFSSQPTPAVQGVEAKREEAQVLRVVDGDTIEVLLDNKKTKIRVIGIDTPEVVDPRKPVECFGKEASDFAKQLLTGKTVILEADHLQSEHDKYGRLLRYVWFDNGSVDFGLSMIVKGYAYEFTYDMPYKYQKEYKQAQDQARRTEQGLWKVDACAHGSS